MVFSELVRIAIENPQIFIEVLPMMDPKRFTDGFERRLVKEILVYHKKYKRIPSIGDLDLTFKSLKNKANPNLPNMLYNQFKVFSAIEVHTDRLNDRFIKDKIMESIRNKAVRAFLTGAAKDVEEADAIELEKLWFDMKSLVTSVQENKMGLSVHDNIAGILKDIDNTAIYNRLPTKHWTAFDKLLRGGVGREEIMLYMAPSGKGKTTFLVNMAYLLMHNVDINILCITTELRDTVFSARLFRRILEADRATFQSMDKDKRQKGLDRFFKVLNAKLQVKYYKPNTATPLDILAAVEQFEATHQECVDVVILDYLDKMKIPRGPEYRHHLQDATEELRYIALDKKLAMITATQTNREGMKKGIVTGGHISEGIGKHMSSDVVITMCQTEEERGLSEFKLRFDKVREFPVPPSQLLYMDIEPDALVIQEDLRRTLMAWKDKGFNTMMDE